jgi:hypothetical protein
MLLLHTRPTKKKEFVLNEYLTSSKEVIGRVEDCDTQLIWQHTGPPESPANVAHVLQPTVANYIVSAVASKIFILGQYWCKPTLPLACAQDQSLKKVSCLISSNTWIETD